MTIRPSHPNQKSSLVDHCSDVSRIMFERSMTSLLKKHENLARFICIVAGLLHDILKDTEAFEAYLRSGSKGNDETRHTGGSAFIAFCVAKQILDKDKELLVDHPLRPYLPCLVFSIVASHHDRIKMIDIYKEHRKAIKHWQVSRGGASKALCEAIEKEFKISIDLEKIDETLNALLDGNFLEWIDFSKATGEIAFDLISINRIFLGAFSVADAESARSQTFGEKISFNPLCPEKARVRSPQISSKDVGLNKLRSSFQNYVRENASGEKGAYLIKAPTGLGKTFAAARVIDKLQTEKGPCKIFYLAPTVTILNQISQEFRNLVEDENLLEIHYMANSPQESEKLSKEEIIQRELKLATWDAGMIITTYHRIISLFSNMAKKGCCNLYGLKEAIFIFDECQFISHIQYPVFSSLVSALAEYCGARFFFMSATPQDESMWNRGHRVLKWEKIPPITKLLHDNQLSKLEGDKMVDGRRLIHPKKDITLLEDLKREITRYRDENPP